MELRNSCQGESACSGATTGTIGYDSCNDEGACEGAVGATIGDNSCNDIEVCKDCEAGSVVPPNTCNYIPNDVILIEDEDPEVGLLDNDINKPRCRACFVSTHDMFHFLYPLTYHVLIRSHSYPYLSASGRTTPRAYSLSY